MNIVAPVHASPDHDGVAPPLPRLRRLGALDDGALSLLLGAMGSPRQHGVRTAIGTESAAAGVPPRLLLAGWAARTRILADGRRQILELLLPGDLIAPTASNPALTGEAVVALTPATSCTLDPAIWAQPVFDTLRLREAALTLLHLHNQITRLGRQSAYERLAHLLLELRERLAHAGFDVCQGFAMPLTQEVLGDVLGLTTVHLNRTMQQLRRDGLVHTTANGVALPDGEALAAVADYSPPRL